MEEYIVIHFNEDGGVNMALKTKEQVDELLEELSIEVINPTNYFFNEGCLNGKELDSMIADPYKRYMIIRGNIVFPKIISQITKLEI